MAQGRNYIFRTAAGLLQMLGGIEKKPLLKALQLYPSGKSPMPGLVVIGSYVQKTTAQFEKLKELKNIDIIEFEVMSAFSDIGLETEVNRIVAAIESAFAQSRDACVFTSRSYHRADADDAKVLNFSNRVSAGLVGIVSRLKSRPGFLVAKGGITSSDIGVNGLGIQRAMVMGQIQPGVPVWELDQESRYPGLPYVIFPWNEGDEATLKKVVENLRD